MFDWFAPLLYLLAATGTEELSSGSFSMEQLFQPPLLYAFIGGLLLLLLFFVALFRYLKKRRHKKALAYHIEEKDKYHVRLEAKNLSALLPALLEGLGGKDNIQSLRSENKRLKVGILQYDLVKESCIREAGFPGLIRPRKDEVQILVGEDANSFKELLAQELGIS